MLLTIITRTYAGRERCIRQAAKFVFEQTYRPIEWLIVEDGPAGSAQALSGAVPEGISVRIVRIEKGGRSAAANEGLRQAKGRLLGFFDDDDEIFPNHAELLVSLLDARPDAAGAYAAAYQTEILEGKAQFDTEKVFLVPTVGSYPLIWTNIFPIQAVIFRADAARMNLFDENMDALEDHLFWLTVFLERKLVWTPEVTSRFFVSGGDSGVLRVADHHAMLPYFEVQKNALMRERGLESEKALRAEHERRIGGLLGRVLQPVFSSELSTEPLRDDRRSAAAVSDLHAALRAEVKDRAPRERAANVAFTSITLGYLSKAAVLAESFKKHHPDWEFHILLNDILPEDLAGELANVDRIVNAASLHIPNFHSWSFGMSVVELCCATKPFYFNRLLQSGYENIFFIDPDICLFAPLNDLVRRLEDNDVLITPHCDKPAIRDAEVFFTERSVLAHGLYNLGFLAARNSANAGRVIEFWQDRMVRYCVDDHRNGLFTDQKWFNLVPLYFDGVHILTHEGCNVASWNITHRPLSERDGVVFAGREPLLFFHFSGYDANVPRQMFEIFGRYNAILERMLFQYSADVDRYERLLIEAKRPWAFRSFDNGAAIDISFRRFFRGSLDNRVLYPEPYFTDGRDTFFGLLNRIGIPEIKEKYAPIRFG